MDKKDFNEIECDKISQILKVLGHPIRLKIVMGLLNNSCNVKKMWECLNLPQATVSQHLHVLKSQGILKGKRQANEIYYTIEDGFVKQLAEIIKITC